MVLPLSFVYQNITSHYKHTGVKYIFKSISAQGRKGAGTGQGRRQRKGRRDREGGTGAGREPSTAEGEGRG